MGTVPIVGEHMRLLLQGGPDMGNLTLTRFFALHGFVLPGAVIALVSVHLYFFRLHGVTTSWWEEDHELHGKTEPFWPGQVFKDLVVALALLIILTAWVFHHPAPLGDIADPSKAYEARPEWYFMFLFQLLRYFHGPFEVVGTFVLPSLFFAILFFWPFIDRTPSRDPRHRPFAMTLLGMSVIGLVGMTVFAIETDVRMSKPEIAMQPKPAPSPMQKIGAAGLYSTNCLACHGVDGTGNALRVAFPTIPDMTSDTWQKTQTDENFSTRIHEGKENSMPAFKDKLNADQIRALVAYVRAFSTKDATAK
jgi:ubiquinol-cytochrome c reductase cytochrome b subunit